VCNLCSMTKNVDATRRLFAVINSQVGNLPSMPGISIVWALRGDSRGVDSERFAPAGESK
jgi:hypothetical protein